MQYRNIIDSQIIERNEIEDLIKGKVVSRVITDDNLITITLKDRSRKSRKEYELSLVAGRGMDNEQIWNEWELIS